MPNWQLNGRVYHGQHSLQTSSGPALAVLGGALFMVYLGDGGENLWYAMFDNSMFGINPNTTPKIEIQAISNTQIRTVNGRTPKSSYAPALAVVDAILHMVYASSNTEDLWWSWFDGQHWHGDIKIATVASGPKPTIATRDGKTIHLVFEDSSQSTIWVDPKSGAQSKLSSLQHNTSAVLDANAMGSWTAATWNGAQPIGYGSYPALVKDLRGDLQLFAKTTPDDLDGSIAQGMLPGVGAVGFSTLTTNINPPVATGGEAGVVFNNKLLLLYQSASPKLTGIGYGSGNEIRLITFDPVPGQHLSNDAVAWNGTLQTSAVIGVTPYDGKLCIAYKGQSSHNVWMAYAS